MIGGIGSGNISVLGSNSFGKINVNSTAATGTLSTGSDALVASLNPDDTFNFIAGAGMQLQYNIASRSIVVVNTLASNPGEVNAGINVGQGVTQQPVYAGKTGLNLEFRGFDSTNTTNSAGDALTISTNVGQDNIVYNFNEGHVNLSALNSGAPTIAMLSDVSLAAPSADDTLRWNVAASEWVPAPISSSSSLATLTDVSLSGLANDQLLVYNSGTSKWENATLAAYNLNAISLVGGGVSIQLSDGTASSDVDLLPGANISFVVNAVTDEITISAVGAAGITRTITSIAVNTTAGALSSTDYVYLASNTINLTLPTAVGNTNKYTIKNVDVGTVVIDTTLAQTIDNAGTHVLAVQYTSISVISDGTNWLII
jgi:hypothetical protein